MDRQTKDQLLAEIRAASSEVLEARDTLLAAASRRGELVRQALAEDLPRQEIAEAAGVARTAVYRIASK